MDKDGIRNIIFDFGGVICELDRERCTREFEKLGCRLNIFPQEYAQFEGLFKQLDRGTISEATFYEAVRREGNIPEATDVQIREAWNSLLVPVTEDRLEAFSRLKEHYDLYILSNTNAVHWPVLDGFLEYRGERVTPWFKQVFLSFEMHLEKPEPEIFQSVLSTAGIEPRETLFIDDNRLNIESAASLGIRTLLSTGGDWVPQLTSWLE